MSESIDDFTDDELYASYEAYKTLLDAGLSKEQALERTGLTAQIVKDFDDEEKDDDFKSEFEDEWDSEEELDTEFGDDDEDFNDDADEDFGSNDDQYD